MLHRDRLTFAKLVFLHVELRSLLQLVYLYQLWFISDFTTDFHLYFHVLIITENDKNCHKITDIQSLSERVYTNLVYNNCVFSLEFNFKILRFRLQ